MLMEKEAKTKELMIETLQLQKAALVLRAENHQLRQQLLQLIGRAGKISVTDIYQQLQLEQSTTSQQLAILRKAGLVATQRNGKQVYYALNYQRLQQVRDLIRTILT